MARRSSNAKRDTSTAAYIVSTAVGAAETLSVGVLRLTERTLLEALRTVEDVGHELGATAIQAARGSMKAAEVIGGDLAEIGRGVSRAIVQPAREMSGGVARLATGLWSNVTEAAGRSALTRKPPAKTAGRRSRKRAAA